MLWDAPCGWLIMKYDNAAHKVDLWWSWYKNVGYENKNWWGFIEPDYRFIPTRDSSNLLIGFNAGYKISRKFAVHAKFKPRIIGSDFYESFESFGGTWYR